MDNISKKDVNNLMPVLRKIMTMFYQNYSESESLMNSFLDNFFQIIYGEVDIFPKPLNITPTGQKIDLIIECLHGMLYYIKSSVNSSFNLKIMILLNGMLHASLRQEYIVYYDVMDKIRITFKDLLLSFTNDKFEYHLSQFDIGNSNIPQAMTPIIINTKCCAYRFLTAFCDILHCQISTMILLDIVTDDVIDDLILVVKYGDFSAKHLAIYCLSQCFDVNRLKLCTNLSFLTLKRALSLTSLLFEISNSIVGRISSVNTVLESAWNFDYGLFEKDSSRLFGLLTTATSYNDMVTVVTMQKINQFLRYHLFVKYPESPNDVFWSVVTNYCELATNLIDIYSKDSEFLFGVCLKSIFHTCNNTQFQRIVNLMVSLLIHFRKIDLFQSYFDKIVETWRICYNELENDLRAVTITRFVRISQFVNFMLLNKDNVLPNRNMKMFHICSEIRMDRILQPSFIRMVADSLKDDPLKFLEFLSIFTEEFCVTEELCQYSKPLWMKMCHLICLWYFKKDTAFKCEETIDPIFEELVDLGRLQYNRHYSYFLLSFLPNDIWQFKSNISRVLLTDTFAEVDLMIMFQSLRNNIAQNSANMNDMYQIINAIYCKYSDILIAKKDLIEDFFSCLQLLHCKTCSPLNIGISKSLKDDSVVYYPIKIAFKTTCLVCTKPDEYIEDRLSEHEVHLSILNLTLLALNNCVECDNAAYFQPSFKLLLKCIFTHFTNDWKEESIQCLTDLLKTGFMSYDNDLRFDISYILPTFVEKICKSRAWPRTLQSLITMFDYIVRNEDISDLKPIILALESLLKVLPFQNTEVVMKLICEIALFNDNVIKHILYNTIQRVVAFRKISTEQLFKQCIGCVVDTVCFPVFRRSVVECLSSIFNMKYDKFYRILLPHIFITIVIRGSPDSYNQIDKALESVSWTNPNESKFKRMLQTFIVPEIIVDFFINVEPSRFEEIKTILLSYFGLKLETFCNYEDITRSIHLFMVHLSEKPDNVYAGLNWIAHEVLNIYGAPDRTSQRTTPNIDEIGIFLRKYSVGILDYYKQELLNDKLTQQEHERVISSLELFIKLLNNGLKNIRMMCFSILKICLKFSAAKLLEKSYTVWIQFITLLDTPDLEGLLVESMAVLLSVKTPLINKIKDILNYIFSKIDTLKSKICDLHFILDFPKLNEFHPRVLKIISEENSEDSEFIAQLKICNRNILHSNALVRNLAATNLFKVLATHLNDISQLMSIFKQENETDTDNMELIFNLNHALISAITRDSDKNRIVFARCLGLLGEVDPGRYRKLRVSNTDSKITEFVTSPKFSFFVLSKLAKVYLGIKNADHMDSVSVTIQELLKTFKYPGSNYKPSKIIRSSQETHQSAFSKLIVHQDLYDLFPSQTKEIFQPFLQSRYVIKSTNALGHVSLPFFSLKDGMTLNYWLCNLTEYLVSILQNPEHQTVFSHSRVIIGIDGKFAKYILPHVILAILIENEPDVVLKINEEITIILEEISYVSENENNLNNSTIINLSTSSKILLMDSENNKILHSVGQVIFKVLDYLQSWLNETRNEIIKNKTERKERQSSNLSKNYDIVNGFVKAIPNKLIAMASFKCGSLARSIQHWMLAYRFNDSNKDKISKQSNDRKEIIMGLIKAHAALNNSDEISGYLTTFKSDLEPFAKTLKLEYERRYDLALSIYEHQLTEHIRKNNDHHYDTEGIDLYRSIFRCQLFNVAAIPSIISRVDCCLNDASFPIEQYQSMINFRIECLYKLGDWKRLEQSLVMDDYNNNWTTSISKVLCFARNEKSDLAHKMLENIWKREISNLEVSSVEGCDYERVHSDLSRFSILTEIEMMLATKEICDVSYRSAKQFKNIRLNALPDFFNNRYKLSEASIDSRTSILTSHFNLFQLNLESRQRKQSLENNKMHLSKIDFIKCQIGEIWLQRCKLARRAKHFLSASACLLYVEKFDYVEFSIEQGKLFWRMNCLEECLDHLDRSIEYLTPKQNVTGNRNQVHKKFWKLILLRAYVRDVNHRNDFATTKQFYESVFQYEAKSEAAHFRLAHFLDESFKLTKDYNEDMLSGALSEYGKALMYGSRFVYQSMPRLLSLWLDKSGKKIVKNSAPINAIMKQNIELIPKFQFYIALSQILSRLCSETNKEIYDLLDDLVVKIYTQYPQQTIWALMSLEGSTFTVRQTTFMRVTTLIKNRRRKMAEYIQKLINLSKLLKEISEIDQPDSSGVKLHHSMKSLGVLLKSGFTQVMIPLHYQLFGTLPSPATFSDSYSLFPSSVVCIANIESNVDILPSLTKPKKMYWHGTDGKRYILVAKPKDDMRRDARITELNSMFNRLMLRNTETRHRLLYIRTYAVTPLGEKCGLIEWVNNTESFKNIVTNLHIQRNNSLIWPKLKARYGSLEDSPELKYHKFVKDIIPMYPAVLHRWFMNIFQEPSAWYRSLERYTRSVAVMSIVGYILGLGDRHIENILFDHTTGDIIHIDFNCLFNLGRKLEWPEVVPFRLTRNMQDALGPCGVNSGLFRSSCEATLRLLRDEIEPIMAVFRPMYNDTLIEIKDRQSAGQKHRQFNETSATENRLEEMESRLKGIVNGLPMSIEGQVNQLISEAIDNKLLCQMFFGWGSYL